MLKMNNLYRFFSVASISLCSVSAFAQKDTTIHQSMTVERDFSPIVRDANKIDQQPQIVEPKITKSPTRYADWVAGEARSKHIGRMSVGQVFVNDDPYKNGYIQFSAGNYVNADLDACINYKDFTIGLDGFMTKGDLDLPYPDLNKVLDDNNTGSVFNTWASKLMQGNVKLGYNHAFSNGSRIRAHVGAGGRNYNMLNTVYTTYPIEEYELFEIGGNYDPYSQKLGRIFADATYDFKDFSVALGYAHSGLKYPDMSENALSLKGEYGWYYEDNWQLKTVLDLGFQMSESNYFTIRPELQYSRFQDGQMNRFYANFAGGLRRPDLFDQMNVMPLALPMMDYKPEKQLFDLTLGYENNDKGYFKWGFFIEGSFTLDRLGSVMSSIFTSDDYFSSGLDKDIRHITYARLTRSDEFEFKGGAYFDYEYGKLFGFKGGLNFNTNPRFGDAVANVDLHLLSNPVNKLFLDLSFNGGFGREMDFEYTNTSNSDHLSQSKLANVSDLDLGTIYDLGFRAEYKVMENFGVFLFGKNLMNCEYQLWGGVPAQKINIHAGFNWHF